MEKIFFEFWKQNVPKYLLDIELIFIFIFTLSSVDLDSMKGQQG